MIGYGVIVFLVPEKSGSGIGGPLARPSRHVPPKQIAKTHRTSGEDNNDK